MSDGSTVLLLLRMAVSLAVVLGLLVWAARAVNRRQGGLLGGPQPHVPVTVLGRQSLSRHAGLSVVQVGAEILVLGVTDAEVSLLTRLDPATLPEPAPQDRSSADAADAEGTHGAQGTQGIEGPLATRPAPTFTEALRRAAGDSLRQGTGLSVRRDAKRQARSAQLIADQLTGRASPTDRAQGRHRG